LATKRASWDEIVRAIEQQLGPCGFSIFGKVEQGQLLSLAGKRGKKFVTLSDSQRGRMGLMTNVRRTFDVPYELFPVQHRFLDLGCAPIHCVDEGSGETLLLLHGNPAWCFLYRKS